MKLDEAREEGRKEADERNKRAFVINLVSSTSFSTKKIASLARVSETFVNKVKLPLKK